MATEEIEVNVKQVDGVSTTPTSIIESLRKLLLASVGAVAMTGDEVNDFVKRLVERGELAQKDAQKLLSEVTERIGQRPADTQHRISETVENSFEQFLNRLNIPSKRDIDELSVKIAQLAERVEELRKNA